MSKRLGARFADIGGGCAQAFFVFSLAKRFGRGRPKRPVGRARPSPGGVFAWASAPRALGLGAQGSSRLGGAPDLDDLICGRSRGGLAGIAGIAGIAGMIGMNVMIGMTGMACGRKVLGLRAVERARGATR